MITLSDYGRCALLTVKTIFNLGLNQATLFFNNQHFLQRGGKFSHAFGVKRPGHPYLIYRQTNLGSLCRIDPQISQGLHHIHIGFACGHYAKLGR